MKIILKKIKANKNQQYKSSKLSFISRAENRYFSDSFSKASFNYFQMKVKLLRFFITRQSVVFKYSMMLFTIIFIVISLPKGGKFKYEYEKGKLWMHPDLVASFNMAIEKSPEELEAEKNEVKVSVYPFYKIDEQVAREQSETLLIDFEKEWNNAKKPESSKIYNYSVAKKVLESIYKKGIISYNKKFQRNGDEYNLTIVNEQNVGIDKNTNSFYTVATALAYTDKQISKFREIDSLLLRKVLENKFVVNVIYDEVFTTRIQDDLIKGISSTRGIVQKGELIVSRGSIVDSKTFMKLESIKNEFEDRIGSTGNRYVIILGQFILVALIVILLMVFLSLFRKDIFQNNRKLSLILLVVTSMLVILSFALKFNLPGIYFIPYCIVPIIIRILFDTRLALYIHLLVVIVAGFFVPNGFEFVFLQITAGMVAIYSIKNLIKRSQLLISAIFIFGTYFFSYVGISIIHEGNFDSIDFKTITGFGLSVLLSLLAYPLIYIFEKLFGITSEVTLMELANTNNKLLKDLSFKAPGTFQHSLQVANLAEAAIFQIGGNSLLVRAGALYHDIGKMDNPGFFIENQNSGNNPHDQLAYEESARIIIGHVTHGIILAKKNRLPELLIDFIRTHHGNTRVDYFYQSFLKNYPESRVDDTVFRYPGPIPFSKETAVLMLADSVEAASRSLKEHDEQSIENLVERIIDYKVDQNQLINSDITLKDIAVIKNIFKNMLMSIFHVRIQYPIRI